MPSWPPIRQVDGKETYAVQALRPPTQSQVTVSNTERISKQYAHNTYDLHHSFIFDYLSLSSSQQSVAAAAAAFLQNYYHYYSECVIQCFKIEKNNWFYQKLDAKNITFRCFLCRRVADLILAQFPFEDKAAYLQKNTRKVGWLVVRTCSLLHILHRHRGQSIITMIISACRCLEMVLVCAKTIIILYLHFFVFLSFSLCLIDPYCRF